MLFTFPSRYSCTIGLTGVFSLAGWSRRIRAGFLVSRVTQDTTGPRLCSCTGLSPSVMQLSRCFHSTFKCRDVVLQPRGCIATAPVWALPRSLATTGGIISYFLFLEVLRCFSSLRSPPPTRGLSQLITSFFASVSQGIRHAPFPTFSPILTRCVSTRSGKLILSAVGFKNYRLNFYSLACVNMSKNSEKRPAVPDSGLTSSILFSLCGE